MIVARPTFNNDNSVFVSAICAPTDSVGDIVYISGNVVGNDYQITKVDPTLGAKMPGVGVITAKITSTRAVIQFEGFVKNVYTGLLAGKTYFVGTNSKPTNVCPTPGIGGAMYVQPIGVAVDANILELRLSDDLTILRG